MSVGKLNKLRKDAIEMLHSGIEAVTPRNLIPRYFTLQNHVLKISDINGKAKSFQLDKFSRIFVIGAGKASTSMAKEIETILGKLITSGLVVTKYNHKVELKIIQLHEAGHPLPDINSIKGSEKIIDICKGADKNDLIINLISGGASSLLALPITEITLSDKIKTNDLLIKSGANIKEINIIRKHISLIKGGRLAEYTDPATIINLVVSDVVGDDLDIIGSGTTVPDSSTFRDAWEIFLKYDLENKIPINVRNYIKNEIEKKKSETLKASNKIFKNVYSFIIGNNKISLNSIAESARQKGYNPKIIYDNFTGKVKEAAKIISNVLVNPEENEIKINCYIFGGETEVKVRGQGKGGRNQELCLYMVKEISGMDNVVFLSAGSDGTDGPTDAAGAICDSRTLDRARKLGMSEKTFLKNNDSYNFFKKLEDLIITGPTGTNVMDIQILITS